MFVGGRSPGVGASNLPSGISRLWLFSLLGADCGVLVYVNALLDVFIRGGEAVCLWTLG